MAQGQLHRASFLFAQHAGTESADTVPASPACFPMSLFLQVMLYDDEQGDCITPEDVFEQLEDDLAAADAVLWIGISFEQSASTEYFRKVCAHFDCVR
jgi:hypothetical protein